MPTFVFSGLKHAAFDGGEHPDALVHVPERLNPGRFGLVVYLHGWENCIENAASAPPGIHDPPHPSADLIGQLERSGRSAILFLPETRYHARSSEPGRLSEPGGFERLWQEVHGRLRSEVPQLADSHHSRVEHIVLVSHSGGYRAAGQIAHHGGMVINELCLLDSLYDDLDVYKEIAAELVSQHANAKRRRLVNLYRGGTEKLTLPLVEHMRELLTEKRLPEGTLLFDESEAQPDDATLSRPLVIKRVSTEHSDLGKTYVEALLRTSGLPGEAD